MTEHIIKVVMPSEGRTQKNEWKVTMDVNEGSYMHKQFSEYDYLEKTIYQCV